MLKWVQVKIPTVTASSILTTELWDDVGIKLWDAATTGNAEAQRMLPWWRTIFETLKAQETVKNKDTKDRKGLPVDKKTSEPLEVGAAKYPPEDDPFDPGPVDPEEEPDLYPPDPQDVWANIKRQALERQIDNVEAREILLLKLAVEMVEACNRIGTVDHKFEAMAAAFAAMRGTAGPGVCYGCGKPGHLKKIGQPIQGNRSRSAGRRRVQTQVPQLTPPLPQRDTTVPQAFTQPQPERRAGPGNQPHNSNPPIVRHFNTNASLELQIKPPVLIRDPETARLVLSGLKKLMMGGSLAGRSAQMSSVVQSLPENQSLAAPSVTSTWANTVERLYISLYDRMELTFMSFVDDDNLGEPFSYLI
ncbi:uncharacterized protein LOC122153500 [Tyto alba]|uniref:uncharacterized protein LOC122153500 n=1 Tax=Tyto alba TaxID=56313 RepID=UPI001C667ABD|nr:uncharacterized protein LOC122153500 [Tyto alba]